MTSFPGRRTFRAVLRRMVLLLGVAAASIALGLVVLLVTAPDVRGLADADPPVTAYIARARAAGMQVQWIPVPLEKVSLDMQLAVLVSEDLRFFHHHGFDFIEIRNALRDAAHGKALRGASTITQQLARNLWLSRKRSVFRKLREAVIAWKLERHLSKRRIFELYLNTAIFAPDAVGVEAGARKYFHRSAAGLDPVHAAQLATALLAPTKMFPGSGSPRAGRQVRRILTRMGWPTGLREELLRLEPGLKDGGAGAPWRTAGGGP